MILTSNLNFTSKIDVNKRSDLVNNMSLLTSVLPKTNITQESREN